METTELQKMGFELAKQVSKRPLQEKIDILASTFGCKSGGIKSSPCRGKWRGTSDVFIVFDDGRQLFLGNCRTPQAKTKKCQNILVDHVMECFHPEVVAEAKRRALPKLKERELRDNAISEQKGLMPYSVLGVELNDGSDRASSGYIGWYFLTLNVGDKTFSFLETGLSHDIARGQLMDREEYFVAGGINEQDVDFVYNNVGHSTTSELYKLPMS